MACAIGETSGIIPAWVQVRTREMPEATRSPYKRDDTHFPVYVMAAFAAAWITDATLWLALAVAAAGFCYYNLPLLEAGRPTIGANQYGIFIQAFGLIRWRARTTSVTGGRARARTLLRAARSA
jgi:hypothetical protein